MAISGRWFDSEKGGLDKKIPALSGFDWKFNDHFSELVKFTID